MIIDSELEQKIEDLVVKPSIQAIQRQGCVFRGVLFIGLMVSEGVPYLLEYNTRLGDPETQVVLPLLDGDWGQVFFDLAKGELKPLKWKQIHCACVVLASPGYPESPVLDLAIEGDPLFETSSSYFVHAGTRKNSDGQWRTNGGRILGSVGLGSSRSEALRNAYQQATHVRWSGLQFRKDIGLT
jgi:phosphoribosylamine--glycine ligase